MKKYVFLVKGIEGLSGGPRYVNNKCGYLKKHGWDVYVFWTIDISRAELEHVIPFDQPKYVFHELQFYPCCFTKNQRNRIIKRIAGHIGPAEQIVVESNKLQLGAWGEMLAQELKAKHINFVTTERIKIENIDTYNYCFAKLKRKEFFTIHDVAVSYLFSNFCTIEHPDAYYWSAMQNVECEEYSFPSFDNMPDSDYTIVSFGRSKGYFPYMLDELESFVTTHHDKTFNIFFLGDLNETEGVRIKLEKKNVHLVLYPKAVGVVPKQIFTKADVVIATAGCACLAAEIGGKVISMDVNKNVPLGLLGYTTNDCNTDSGKNVILNSLSGWLHTLLIEKKEYPRISSSTPIHGFDYQMQFVTLSDGFYYDTSKVQERITRHDKIIKVLIKWGLFRLVDFLFFAKRKKKAN